MLHCKEILHSDDISVMLLTAEYTGVYSEEDFNAFPSVSFPLEAGFLYRSGSRAFHVHNNHILLEREQTEFLVSKYKGYTKDVTLSVQVRDSSALPFLFSSLADAVQLKQRTIEAEVLLRRLYAMQGKSDKLKTEQLLFDLLESLATTGKDVASRYVPLFTLQQADRAREFMHENYHRRLSVAEIAAEVFVSPFHFSRQFRSLTGLSPYAYLQRLRLHHAKDLLRQGMAVTEVAFSCGFNSLEHFSYTFHKEFGCAPVSYKYAHQ